MAAPIEEPDFLRELRSRSSAERGVFRTGTGELAVFDPEAAQRVNAANYGDLTLPDKLADLLRGRAGEPVSWKQVRAAWTAQMRRLSDAEGIGRLAARMSDLLDGQLGRPLDLTRMAQEVSTRSLLPTVVTGLPPTDQERILKRVLPAESSRQSLWTTIRTTLSQVGVGQALRRELRGRATGRSPRQLDLADPLVDLLPALGMDRAVDKLNAVLVAIAIPPGAAAACLLYELTRRPDWAARLAGELAPIPLARLHDAPVQVAPLTHLFVKETLRLWCSPLVLVREVRTRISFEQERLDVGQQYLLSPYILHRDPRHWKQPDTFDPDRWLSGADVRPCPHASYVPFGWAPTTCIGAGLGTAQLILWCHLLCTRYRAQPSEPEAVRIALGTAPLPRNFRGAISRR
jgi:cytochrome P450